MKLTKMTVNSIEHGFNAVNTGFTGLDEGLQVVTNKIREFKVESENDLFLAEQEAKAKRAAIEANLPALQEYYMKVALLELQEEYNILKGELTTDVNTKQIGQTVSATGEQTAAA